ncbi:hypothetical protein VN12_10210 [Pirellula sp. SH-Sr6A]|nr:hypothetical protein VN12_10210 [Pirellula sp. SH-Sr6A]
MWFVTNPLETLKMPGIKVGEYIGRGKGSQVLLMAEFSGISQARASQVPNLVPAG